MTLTTTDRIHNNLTKRSLGLLAAWNRWVSPREEVTERPAPPRPAGGPGDRLKGSWTGTVSAPPEVVFPLLCPVREYEWIDAWACDVVYSESGYAEEDCVVKTRFTTGETAIITRCDEDAGIFQAVWFIGGHALMKLDIQLEPVGEDATRISWRRTYTALDRMGRVLLKTLSPEQIEGELALLTEQLDHCVRTGGLLDTRGHRYRMPGR